MTTSSSAPAPLFPQPVRVIGGSGEVGTGKSFFGLSITDPSELLVLDEEGSSSIYQSLGFKHVNIIDEVAKGSKTSFRPIDVYEWWRAYITSIKPGQYRVIMHDIFSLVDAGLTDWVQANPQYFGHTANQYQKAQGIMWGDVKEMYRVILLEIASRCETFYFTVHMGAEFKGNETTGKRKPKGKETLIQLADLYLVFERRPDSKGNYPNGGKPAAVVAKSRLYSALKYNQATRELESVPALPPRLPIATPNAIREYMLKPVDLTALKEEEKIKEKELSEAERMELQAAIAHDQATVEQAKTEREKQKMELEARKQELRNRVAGSANTASDPAKPQESGASTTTAPTLETLAMIKAMRDKWHVYCGHNDESQKANGWKILVARVRQGATSIKDFTPGEISDLIIKMTPPPGDIITEGQLAELVQIRSYINAAKGINKEQHADKVKSEWDAIIAPYKVTSAKQLTHKQAEELINVLRKQYIPF